MDHETSNQEQYRYFNSSNLRRIGTICLIETAVLGISAGLDLSEDIFSLQGLVGLGLSWASLEAGIFSFNKANHLSKQDNGS
ncbi:MAG: hypothetical protein ACREF7_03985 [Candidatus Saccharimonadales bacterium]